MIKSSKVRYDFSPEKLSLKGFLDHLKHQLDLTFFMSSEIRKVQPLFSQQMMFDLHLKKKSSLPVLSFYSLLSIESVV